MSEIVINQTTINEEKINKEFLKNTPFCLTKGSIDELTLQMSISKIFKEPIKVAAKNIYLELCLNHKQNYFDFLKKISTRNKLKRQNYEQQNKLKQEEIVQDEEKINDYFKKIILKTQVKFENIVIKLNFSKEHASKENSVFMLFKLQKLKTIKTLPNQQDQLKKSLIIQDPHNQSFQNSMSYQFSQSKMGTYQDLGDNQGADQYNLYKLNLQFEQFTVHIMKDSNSNIVNEYKNNLNYQFPFTYPHHLHPSTILYLERMEMNGEQTIDTGETHVAIKLRAIEFILEPYQLKILLDYIVELRKWKQKQDIYEKIRKNQKIMQKSSQVELKIKRFSSKKQASNKNNIKQKIQEESEHSDSDNDSIEDNKKNSQTELEDKSELDLQTQHNKENYNVEIQQVNENIENVENKENKQDQEFNEEIQNEENQNVGEIQNEVNKQNKKQNFENQEEEEQQQEEEQQLNSNKFSYKNRRRLSSQDFDLEENVPVEERQRIFKGLLSEFQNQIQELDTNDLEKSIYQFEQSFQQSFVFHQNAENYQPNFIVNTEVDVFIVQLLKEDIYIQQGGDDLKEYARDWISCKKNTNSSSKKSQGISTNVPVSYFLLKIKTMSLGLARRQVRLEIQQCIKLLDIDLIQMNTKHFSQRGQIIPKKERQDQETNENNNNNQQQQSDQNQEQEKDQEQFIYTSSFQRIKKNLPITLLPMSGQGSHYCVKYIFKIQNNKRQSNFPSQQMNPKDIIKTQQKIKKHNLFKTSRQLQYKYDFQMGEGFQQTRFYKKQSENMDKIKKIINNDTQAQAMQPVALTLQIETSQIQGQKTQNTQVSTGMVNMNLDTIFLKEMKMIFDGYSYRGQQLHGQVDKKHVYKDFLWETYQEEDENYQKDQYIFELGEKLSKIKLIDENEEEDKHAKEKFIQSLKDEKVLQEVSIFIPFARVALLTPLKQIQKETQENQKNEENKKEQQQNEGEEEEELGIEIELESDFSHENKENEFLKKEKEKKMNQIFENFELNQQGQCRCLCNIKAAEKNQNHQNSDFLYHNINVNTNLRANRDIYKYDRNCLFFDLTDFTIDSSKIKEFNFYFCFLEGYLAELSDDNNQQFLTQKIFSIGKNYINKKQVENSFTFKVIQNNKIIENQQLIKKLPDNSFSNLEDMDKFFGQFQKQNIAQSETSLNSDQEDKIDNNEKTLQQNYQNQEQQNIQNNQILSNKIDQKNENGDKSIKNNSNNNFYKNNYKGSDSNNKDINKDKNLKNEVQNNLNQHFSMEFRLGILQLFLTTKKSLKNLKECLDGNLEMMNNMDQFEFFKKVINNQDLGREIKKKVFDIDLFVAESNIFYQLEENDKQQQHQSRQRANSVAKSGVKNKSDNKNLNYQQPKINQLINLHCRELLLELVFKQQIEEKYLECEKSIFQVIDFQNFNIYEILLIDPLANKKVLGVPDKLNDQFQVHKQVYNLDTYFLNSYHVCRDSLYQLNRQIQLFQLNIERLLQDVKGLQEFIKKAQQAVQSKVDEFFGQQVSEENKKFTNQQNQNFKETSRFFQENHKNLQNQFSNITTNKQEQQPYKKTNMYDSIEVYEQNNEYFKENQKIQKKEEQQQI
ncbi:hypothetical protein PPERSA_08436 [Pseudocohnilembus persalinus]|uniref:Uncharacterized protein n=1 Tax=Pseudocohnilembus persalinus TaxID=266149 RepID=A0A0V0R6B2_PSEPJ|nr:hypothetical protein PPERSA_08436 [Pseudocohnilembus persalinus]|eukprot:KRX10033.1 hypothetical protein PPERSA_08436 [Pseudocohnilembus persalinus]